MMHATAHLYAPTGSPNDLLGAPMVPLGEWFDRIPDGWDPVNNLDDPVVYVGVDGRFAVLLAPYGTCLISGAGDCWVAPMSQTGYAWAHAGKTTAVIEADGRPGRRATANIAIDVPHATERSTVRSRKIIFDDTSKAVARVTYHDIPERGGIYALGSLNPTATKWDGLRLQASALSGEWFGRQDLPELELLGAIVVNEPGFRRELVDATALTRRAAMYRTASLNLVGGERAVVGGWTQRIRVRLKSAAASSGEPPKKPTGAVLVALPAPGQWTDDIDGAHATIAYVPNAAENPDLVETMQEFGAEQSIRPFEARVAATGYIGPEGATAVIFNCRELAELNGTLAGRLRGRHGFESAYPNYLPHLTTGYGVEPIEHDSERVVVFDRLALWTPEGRREFVLPLVASAQSQTSRIRVRTKGVGDVRR